MVESFFKIFVDHEVGITSQTVVDWFNYSKEVCTCILEKTRESGRNRQIDIGKKKRRKVDRVWFIVGIERETKHWGYFLPQLRTDLANHKKEDFTGYYDYK